VTIDEYKAGLRAWERDSSNARIIKRKAVELKAHGKSFKSVGYNFYGTDPENPSTCELEFRESEKLGPGEGYDFDNPKSKFTIRDAEIDVLRGFLAGEFSTEGYYVRTDSPELASVLAEQIHKSKLGEDLLQQLLSSLGGDRDLAKAIAASEQAGLLSRLIEHERHIAAIDELERLALDPETNEAAFQKLLQENPWIFGGRFFRVADRREFATLDQLDVPLINTDGSLHIAELKTANIPALYKVYRNHIIMGNDVHEAVSQTENYLHTLDAEAYTIEGKFKIDVHRSFGTVVVGHINHVRGELDSDECNRALRIYNSHLSRVRVMTYDQLIASARNALAFGVSGIDA
jgi:hypothetical protein